jgi:outer membrane protein assembly factor BamD (BamD/ComL family)
VLKLNNALAALAMLVVSGAAYAQNANTAGQPAAPAKPAEHHKAVKDQTEYDLYNNAIKDVQSQNFTKAIADLDTWKQKYPDSDFKDDREVYYIQALAGAKEPAKAVDAAGKLIDRDLNKVFDDPKAGPQMVVKVLFTTVVAAPQIPNPTPEEVATAEKAAHMLMEYNTKPEGASDADWAKAREQMQTAAKGALMYLALKPGSDAMQKKDYATAEADFQKALQQYPDSGQIAYQLGASEVAQQATDPNKVSMGIYEIARGAALDPAKGGIPDPKARAEVDAYLKKIYTSWHGSDEGLDQLKQQALASPTPPPGFHIKTATEIATEKEAEFEKSNPQLALWMKIKAALSDTNGDQYFQSQLKDTAVPQLRGIVVEAKPACHSKELLVAIPLPGADGAPQAAGAPEITLKLDAPLSGKPALNTEFHWEGIPVAFTRDPFMLTMTVDKSKIEGLKVEPCAAAPAHRTTTKKK